MVLDSHPGGFGAQGDHVSAKLQGLHRWLARHVDGCAVASAPWVEVVESWGGRAVELHEAPPGALPASLGDLEERPGGPTERGLRVLCVGRLAPDEPSEEVAAAAALVPDCRFLVTGDPKRAPTLIERAPPNVTFTGYLAHDDYLRALQEADVVMTLTTEPSSVMRAAYEAVYARRPLIVTDWPVGRALFPHAVHVVNDASAIAEGVRRARDGLSELIALSGDARSLQLARWESQLGDLRRVLRLDHDGSPVGGLEHELGRTIAPTLPES